MKKKRLKSYRSLSQLEINILKFLWRWKISNLTTLKYALAPDRSFWKFYKRLKVLQRENYIGEMAQAHTTITFWTLTKKGFQYINDGSMELISKRYKPETMAKDYWAQVLQLGDFVFHTPKEVEFITSQELITREISDLPEWTPKLHEHKPGGLTRIKTDSGFKILAYEIALSNKPYSTYDEMLRFYDRCKPINLVVWLCESEKIISRVTEAIVEMQWLRGSIHNFVLKSDVQKLGWRAPVLWGSMTGKTLSTLTRQSEGQNTSSNVPEPYQTHTMKVFLETRKSPFKSDNLGSWLDPLGVRTP